MTDIETADALHLAGDIDAAAHLYRRVLGAAYGRNCAGNVSTNVTDDLARQCQGRDYCVYRIDALQIGDPRPGCAKEYQARYMCRDGDNERHASASRPQAPALSGRRRTARRKASLASP